MATLPKTKQAALEAARKVLGNDAIEGVDFVIKNTGAGWTHEDIPPANVAAEKAQEKRVVKKASAVDAPPKPKAGGAGKKPPKKPDAPASDAPKKAKAPKADPKPKAEGPTKTERMVAMLKKPGGATSAEMEKELGWQPHSVRGLLGTMRKQGVNIVAKKIGKEPTYYQIKEAPEAAPVTDVV